MALHLKGYFDEGGKYVGVDLHQPSIRWCRRHFATQSDQFQFAHIDVKSPAYNPHGEQSGESFQFPFESHSFDVILLKSVFTHMRPSEVENYLREISRLLNDNGRCLATFFLLDEEQRKLATAGRNALKFSFGSSEWRYVYEHSPESAAAYDETYILKLIEQSGLRLLAPIYYGSWSGRRDGLSFQDMLLITRAS